MENEEIDRRMVFARQWNHYFRGGLKMEKMEIKPGNCQLKGLLELTKEEALSLNMAYRNEVNRFNLMFKSCGDIKIEKAGKEFFANLNLLQKKLEDFIESFGIEK